MPLFGTLKTIPLTDVLQWMASARLTGTLQLERDKVSKSILFRDGQIVGCSSDDPPQRLGQFLIARGKITEAQLRQALGLQETERRHLGTILVGLGTIDPDELASHLEAKAEETILSMFDWPDAVFRFQEDLCDEANVFPVSLRVEDLLLRGARRFDEIQRVREVFDDPAAVLRRTARTPPASVLGNPMARFLYESIDGERTVADIRLHVHGSEYVVLKFLFELHRNGYVELAPPPAPAAPPAEDDPDLDALLPPDPDPALVDRPPLAAGPEAGGPSEAEAAAGTTAPGPVEGRAQPAAAKRSGTVAVGRVDPTDPAQAAGAGADEVETRLRQARAAMSRGDFETALDVFDALYRRFPSDESLRRLCNEAEVAFVEKAYRHYLPPAKVPHLARSIEEMTAQKMTPTEFFLISRIDGSWDVKSIIQIAPLREVDTLRTLKRLRESGIVELHDPRPA